MTDDDRIRVALDRALAEVRAPLESALRVLAHDVEVEATDERGRAAQARIDEVQRSAEAAMAELRASTTRVSEAFHSLDGAQSLGEVLTVLADAAGGEVDRVAVLIVTGGRLRGYRWSGFTGTAPAGSIDLPFAQAGLAGAVVQTGAMAWCPAVDMVASTPPAEALPPFAREAGARDAAALPILLGGTVAAVVYADAPASDATSEWPAVLDLLTRHAGRVLEAMTMRSVTGLSPVPAARRAPDRPSPESRW